MATTCFKLHLTDGDKSMTITENHPKLDPLPTEQNFIDLGAELLGGYGQSLMTVGIQSETTVFSAAD